MRIYRQRAVDQYQQRVTVGSGPRDLTGCQPAVRGGHVLDDHRLAHGFRQPVSNRAGDSVASAAHGGGDDQMDGLGRIGLLCAG